MTIDVATSAQKGWDTGSVTTTASASINPGVGSRLVLIWTGVLDVAATPFAIASVASSGAGPAWTLLARAGPAVGYDAQTAIYTSAVVATASAFTVTIDYNSVDQAGAYSYAIIRTTSPHASTPFPGSVVAGSQAGDGAESQTLGASPLTTDVVYAMSGCDPAVGGGATQDNTARTWTEDTEGNGAVTWAWNLMHSTGSTSTTVAWTDVCTGTPGPYSSAQAAVIIREAASAVSLTVADLTIAVVAEAPAPSSIPILTVADLTIAVTAQAPTLTGITDLVIANLTVATVAQATTVTVPALALYPATEDTTNRKLIDQDGNPIHIRGSSSWCMTQELSVAEIAEDVANAAARGHNTMLVVFDGSFGGTGRTRYTNTVTGNDAWVGQEYASALGPMITVELAAFMDEITANGMFGTISCYPGFSTLGSNAEMAAASDAQCRTAGTALATALAAWDNWILHISYDNATGPDSKVENFCRGVKDVRPGMIIVAEPNQGTDALAQWPPGTFTYFTPIEGLYNYGANSTELVESTFSGDPRSPKGAVWDVEPLYIGHSNSSPEAQEKRYRHYANFVEGMIGENFGHEGHWCYKGQNTAGFTKPDTWDNAFDNTMEVEYGHSWTVLDLTNTLTWAPTSSLVTTGEGTGTSKAAQGTDGQTALAYFPNNRTVAVDTTIIAGTGPVSLRWFDPTAGTFSTISANEAQQTGRSVTIPAAHGDGSRDFILVVEALPTLAVADLTIAITAEAPAVSGNTSLVVADLIIAITAETPAVQGVTTLTVADLTIALTAESPSVSQHVNLVIADLTVATVAEAPAPQGVTTLVPLDLTIAVTAEVPTIGGITTLVVADLTVGLAADAVTLSVDDLPVDLTIANLTVAVTAENATLGGVTDLVIANLTVAVTASNITFGQTDTVPGTVRLLTVPPDGHYRRLPGQPRPKWLNSTPTVKDPDAVLDYPIDWGIWLEDGDELDTLVATVTIHGTTPTSGTPLAFVDEPVISTGGGPIARYVLFSLTGGVPGRWYAVRLHIETAQDDTDDRTRWVRVRNR